MLVAQPSEGEMTPCTPEEIKRLFARHDALAAELRAIGGELDERRRRYSNEHGYCVPLRIEALRREIGA
jgi:hypothetical protein